MKANYNFLFIFLIIVILTTGCSILKNNNDYAKINGIKINLEITQSQNDKIRGLSNRKDLSQDSGMLFQYSDYQIRGFWMKDMLFPIDIIWIKNDVIVGIEKEIPPATDDNLKTYYPPLPINTVLEVNAGFSDKNNIKIGDSININIKK